MTDDHDEGLNRKERRRGFLPPGHNDSKAATTDNYHAESRSARRTTTKERRRPREFSSQRHHDIGTTKRREVSTTTTQRPRRRILTSRCVGINSDTKYTKTTASYPQICTDSHRLIWTSHRGGGLKRAFTTTARRRRDDDYSPSRCVGINSATRTRRREDDDRTDDGLICGDARRYGITTTKCHAEPPSSPRTDWTADRPESGLIVCGAGILPAVLNSYSAGPRRTPIASSMSHLCKSQRIVVKLRISRISQLSRIKALHLAYIRAIGVISGYSTHAPDITSCELPECVPAARLRPETRENIIVPYTFFEGSGICR